MVVVVVVVRRVVVLVVVGCGVVVVVIVVVVVGGCHHGGLVVDTVGLVVAELELVVQSGQDVDEEAGTSCGGVELISPIYTHYFKTQE